MREILRDVRPIGGGASGRHGGTEITRRHYVERNVTVPDYTAALEEYSRPISALRAVMDEATEQKARSAA